MLALRLLITLLVVVIGVVSAEEFFVRNAKWSKLVPSGGSLVSGRGNFRPGFNSGSWRAALAEPSFGGFKKRSFVPSHRVEQQIPLDKQVLEYMNI